MMNDFYDLELDVEYDGWITVHPRDIWRRRVSDRRAEEAPAFLFEDFALAEGLDPLDRPLGPSMWPKLKPPRWKKR